MRLISWTQRRGRDQIHCATISNFSSQTTVGYGKHEVLLVNRPTVQ
jgi:hypothetical protein